MQHRMPCRTLPLLAAVALALTGCTYRSGDRVFSTLEGRPSRLSEDQVARLKRYTPPAKPKSDDSKEKKEESGEDADPDAEESSAEPIALAVRFDAIRIDIGDDEEDSDAVDEDDEDDDEDTHKRSERVWRGGRRIADNTYYFFPAPVLISGDSGIPIPFVGGPIERTSWRRTSSRRLPYEVRSERNAFLDYHRRIGRYDENGRLIEEADFQSFLTPLVFTATKEANDFEDRDSRCYEVLWGIPWASYTEVDVKTHGILWGGFGWQTRDTGPAPRLFWMSLW